MKTIVNKKSADAMGVIKHIQDKLHEGIDEKVDLNDIAIKLASRKLNSEN